MLDRAALPRSHLPVLVAAFAVIALLCGETMEASPSAMRSTAGGLKLHWASVVRVWKVGHGVTPLGG